MGEEVYSLLWGGIVLGVCVCPYCHGFPAGKRHYDCENFKYCSSMDSDSFQIPNERDKIQTFIKEYQSGRDFFGIAKLMWGEETPEKIGERARSCKDKIRILKSIGEIMTTKLSTKEKTYEEYMKDKIEELKKMI